jgi:nucleotide-binding universal stress UspA family protein
VSLRGGNQAVLGFAFAAAARYETPLLAVHAAGRHPGLSGSPHQGGHQEGGTESAELQNVLRPWREMFPGVHVVEHFSRESPARAVVEIAPGAGLLVVGRGRHSALGPQIGPVTHAAIHHASCPVAVVPHA